MSQKRRRDFTTPPPRRSARALAESRDSEIVAQAIEQIGDGQWSPQLEKAPER